MVLSSLGSPDTFSENTRTQFCVQFKEFHRPVTNTICSNTGPSSLLPRSVREPSVLCSQFTVHSDFLRSPVSLQKASATHPQHSSPSLVAGRRESKTKQKRASDLKNEVAGSVCGPFVPLWGGVRGGRSARTRPVRPSQDPAEWPRADSSCPVCDWPLAWAASGHAREEMERGEEHSVISFFFSLRGLGDPGKRDVLELGLREVGLCPTRSLTLGNSA